MGKPRDVGKRVVDFVRGTERKPVARPQPPMQDSRTKRQRTRSEQRRASIREQGE